jgi:hypothetical protein
MNINFIEKQHNVGKAYSTATGPHNSVHTLREIITSSGFQLLIPNEKKLQTSDKLMWATDAHHL